MSASQYDTNSELELAKTSDQKKFWEKLQPVNRPATSDTYKRTMSGSSEIFADNFSVYTLAARKALKEDGVNGRYIMSGLEQMIYPWFANPVTEDEVRSAEHFFLNKSQVKKFPSKAWQAVLDNDGFFPIDIYALPGGQTFLAKDHKYVPMMTVEGSGALVSHLEPHLENIYAPIIFATKAKLMEQVTGKKFAEFGLRAERNENLHVALMLSLYVGGGFQFTSDDQSAFLFPEYFKDIGTVGHEFIMAYQKAGLSLEGAQEQAFEDFVKANDRSALLPDVIHTINSGIPAILRLKKKYDSTGKIIMPRFDSGDVPYQCIYYKKEESQLTGITPVGEVVEDGYNPTKARDTKKVYADGGYDPSDIFVGSGGYFQEGNVRDAASLVYKRSATEHDGVLEPSLKFSDSPGKESLPGRIRIYGKDNKIIVAQADENIDGIMLSQKIVDNGRIVYNEDLETQRKRAEETWNKYDTIEYSPKTQEIIIQRTQERNEILARLGG